MKIKKIYIENFGCLSNFSYTFDDEVNIIKFDNEHGKTTIAEFIRAMLYGFNSGVRNIRNNPRKKYMPWGKSAMGGEILVQHEGNDYLIIRTFGAYKGDDKINVINNVTGETAEKFCTDCPCFEMTGIGADAFDKALYLNHFSVDMDSKKDEIMDKLVALSQSGDEEFSYKRATEILDDAIKTLSNSRSGKIKEIKEQISDCYAELKDKLKMQETIDSLKRRNKVLEKQEEQLKEQEGKSIKKYGVVWAVMLVLSVASYFLLPWFSYAVFGATVIFVLICILKDKRANDIRITKLLQISREIGENNGILNSNEDVGLGDTQDKMKCLESKITKYEKKLADLFLARECLDDAFEKIQQGFGTKLNKNVAEILSVITNGKYDGVKVNKNFEMKIHCESGWQSAQFLSDGAYSQIYFALKMSIVKMLFEDMPIVLDDPFALYDEKRKNRALEYLSNCGTQVILLVR